MKARTGTDDLSQVFGGLDLPLSDTLAARVSGGLKKRDGYVTRVFDGLDLGDDNTYNLNAKVRWEPTDAFSFVLKADYAHEDENGSPFVFTDINEAQVFPIAVSVGAGCPGAVFPPPLPVPNIDDPRCANDFYNLGEFTNELDDGDHITEFVAAGPKNYAYNTFKGKQCCKVRRFTLNKRGQKNH